MTAAYDLVITGSSPACLIEATCNAALGKRVLIVERSDRLGGAWSTVEIPGFERVEFGAHLIANYAKLYEKMNHYLNAGMAPLRSQPKYVTRNAVFTNSDKIWFWRDLQKTCKAFITASPDAKPSLRYLLNYYPRAFLKFWRYNGLRITGYHYPEFGISRFLEYLENSASRLGVDIALNVGIESVKFSSNQEHLQLGLANCQTVLASQLILPSFAHIPHITLDEKAVELPLHESRAVTLFLVIEDPIQSDISYLHFGEEPLVLRVSDITPYVLQTEQIEQPLKLLAVQIHPQVSESRKGYLEEPEVRYIFERLQEQSLISQNATLCRYHWHTYKRQYSDWQRLKKQPFDSLNGRIAYLNTVTLSDSFLENFPRWEAALEKAGLPNLSYGHKQYTAEIRGENHPERTLLEI